jgi:hypothetical protein
MQRKAFANVAERGSQAFAVWVANSSNGETFSTQEYTASLAISPARAKQIVRSSKPIQYYQGEHS